MKKYFVVEDSAEARVVGDYPQCHSFVKEFTKKENELFNQIYDDLYGKDHKIPDSSIRRLDGYKLSGRAKLTDCLSHVKSFVPFVNEKALNVFTRFNLGEYRIIPGMVLCKKKMLEYYFIYQHTYTKGRIVWPKCEFVYWRNKEQLTFSFQTAQEYYDSDYYLSLSPKKIVLDKNFPKDFDMFWVSGLGFKYFVSEELKTALEADNITGIEFNESTEIVIEED